MCASQTHLLVKVFPMCLLLAQRSARDAGIKSNVETSREDIESWKIPSRREAEKYSPFLHACYFMHVYLIFLTKSCIVGIFITILQQRN